MTDRSTTYIIMTLVVIIIICGIMIAPAFPARGCLEREQAQRTWPTKTLGVDDDGCWTYMRRGINPPPKAPVIDVPVDILAPGRASVAMEVAAGLDLMQRWPSEIEMRLTPYEPFKEPEPPLLTARNMWAAILSVVLFCAVLEVIFGGKVIKQKEAPPWSAP